jgi:DNA-binding IclR family transcriptional regulator
VAEEEIVAFIRDYLGSVYALELLLLIKRHSAKAWRAADLVRDLRSSGTAVTEALSRLIRAGFVAENPAGRYAFAPLSPKHAQLAAAIEKIYVSTPTSVMKALGATPEAAVKLKE